jgi:hypothetical protein
VSRSTGRAETTGEASPKGARLDAESELTSGPQAEGSGGAAGAARIPKVLAADKASDIISGAKHQLLCLGERR